MLLAHRVLAAIAHPLVEAASLISGAYHNRSRTADKSACFDELEEAATVSLSAELLVDPNRSQRHGLVAEGDNATPDPQALDQCEHQVTVAAEPRARLIQAPVRGVPLFRELTTDRPVELLEIRLVAALSNDHAPHRQSMLLTGRACDRISAEGPPRRRRRHGNDGVPFASPSPSLAMLATPEGIVVQMSIRRVVPDITTPRLDESREFYVGLLGFEVAMDMDWVVTLVSPVNPTAQVILMSRDATAPVQPQMSIEVTNVDAVHQEAVDRGDDIVYPLTDEPWGVRRFFVRDPTGVVINVLGHHSHETADLS